MTSEETIVNTLSPLNSDIKPDDLPAHDAATSPAESIGASYETSTYVDFNQPAVEMERPTVRPAGDIPADASPIAPVALTPTFTQNVVPDAPSNGFLVRYITMLFAGLSTLAALWSLGFALLDHFINKPAGVTVGGLYDATGLVSTWHVWLVASLTVFAILYLTMSGMVSKRIISAQVADAELHVADIARAVFMGILIVTATSMLASLLFTILNMTLAAAEVDVKDLTIQVSGIVMALLWIVVFGWHQAVMRTGRSARMLVGIITSGAVLFAVVAAIFLLAAGRNAVIDSRTVSDLTTIQSELRDHKALHDSYPDDLASLKIDDESIAGRLVKYRYTHESVPKTVNLLGEIDDASSTDSMFDSSSWNTGSSSTDSTYKLCATFLTDASAKASSASASYSYAATTSFLGHKKGEHCVESQTSV